MKLIRSAHESENVSEMPDLTSPGHLTLIYTDINNDKFAHYSKHRAPSSRHLWNGSKRFVLGQPLRPQAHVLIVKRELST